jgi:hypothetical protein
MTGEQSRTLSVGDRVCWENSATDRGTVAAVDWSGVKIVWDNGHSNHIHHNDMGAVTLVPVKI